MITDSTLIISMTSYPARIHCVKDAFGSIISQGEGLDCHYVLALAEPEFPGKEKDLPEDLLNLIEYADIELIWYPRNIRSHKKLMPALKKYPNNPILITDDDIIRQDGWLRMFIDDHEKHPTDVIVGAFMWYFGQNLALKRFNSFKCQKAGTMNGLPGVVFRFARPANGVGGTLYPANTFTDPRFFDEDLMMETCPTSDESWQFCFEILNDVRVRQSSKIYDNSATAIPGTQEMPTALYKVNKYPDIFKKLCDTFPEFRRKLTHRQSEVILSFTTYKNRLMSNCVDDMVKSLLRQTWKPTNIVMTLFKDDVPYVTPYLQELIDNGGLELIVTDEDIKPHKKYFNTMLKYKDTPVITVDDDIIFDEDVVESLMKSYLDHPDVVSSRRVHKITMTNNTINPYKKWIFEYNKLLTPSFVLFATNGAGTLFPPDILEISEDNMDEIRNCINADDIYIKYLETKRLIKTLYVPNKRPMCTPVKDDMVQENALYKVNIKKMGNDEYLKSFSILPDDIYKSGVKIISTNCIYSSYTPKRFSTPPDINRSRNGKQFVSSNSDVFNLRSARPSTIKLPYPTNKQNAKLFY